MRRRPSWPSGSLAGSSGALPGHQTTTGESGSSRGSTTDSGCRVISPLSRISARSPDMPEPMPTSASTRAVPRPLSSTTPRRRAGCSRAAARATDIASEAASSATMNTSVITMPIAGLPARLRARRNSAAIPLELVSVSSIMAASGSWASPAASVSGEHLVGRGRAPGAGLVGVRGSVLGPVLDDRVEDLPRQLDLLVLREQRRLTEKHVEDQPLVRLRAGLGERAPVGEVHVDVPDLHCRAGNLRPEPQRDALVRLHPDHQGVLGELLGGGRCERQMRRPLEHHGDLGDPTPQPFAGAQVERHTGPAAGLPIEAPPGGGLGRRGLRGVLLLLFAPFLLAPRP